MERMNSMLILDFDGTITDAEKEGKPFRVGFLNDLALLTGRTEAEIMDMAETFEADIAKSPDNHGWVYNGNIVAPASVDPYLRIMPVARMIFDACGAFSREEDRTRLMDSILFKYNYQKTEIVFREGAHQTLSNLHGKNVYVVTNSHTEPVQKKIQHLDKQSDDSNLEWLVERVYGRAKKYVVEPSFEKVPESLSLPGLSRPVMLRRPRYFEILDTLRQKDGLEWSNVWVAGDIFELDLALPLALGAHVALATNPFTPTYEKEFLQQHPRGHLLSTISEISEWYP